MLPRRNGIKNKQKPQTEVGFPPLRIFDGKEHNSSQSSRIFTDAIGEAPWDCYRTSLGTCLQHQAYVHCSPWCRLRLLRRSPENLYKASIFNHTRVGTFLPIDLREFYFTTLFSVCALVSKAEKLLKLFKKIIIFSYNTIITPQDMCCYAVLDIILHPLQRS